MSKVKEDFRKREFKNFPLSILDEKIIATIVKEQESEYNGKDALKRCNKCRFKVRLQNGDDRCMFTISFNVPPPRLAEGICFGYCPSDDSILDTVYSWMKEKIDNLPEGDFATLWDTIGARIASVVSFFCRKDIEAAYFVSEHAWYVEHDLADGRFPPAFYRYIQLRGYLTDENYYQNAWEDGNCIEARILRLYAKFLKQLYKCSE